MKINLLPKEYRPQAAVSIPRLAFVLAFVFVIIGLGIWLAGLWFTLIQCNQNLAKTDQDLELYGQQYENIKMLEQQQATIEKKKQEIAIILQPFIPIKECLQEITVSLPDSTWLKMANIEENGKISLEGRTDRMGAIAFYMVDLESSPLLKNVKLESIANNSIEGMGVVFDFKLTFEMEKAGLGK